MSSQIPGKALLAANYGTTVSRAAATLPQTTNSNLFQVTGGRVLLTGFVGEVTVATGATTNNTKITATNTAAGTTQDLCAVVDTASKAVGTLYGFTGTFATAASVGAAVPKTTVTILTTGFVRVDCAANNTGQMRWSLMYLPIDPGAAVVAV